MDLIRTSKKVIKAFTTTPASEPPRLNFVSSVIDNPDAEIGISLDILNEMLHQNFPLKSSVPIMEGKQVDISVENAEICMKPDNDIEISITNASINYDQNIFKVGIRSNVVAVTIRVGVVKEQEDLKLVGYGWFSQFHIKYLPNWVASKLAEVIKTKLMSPLVNLRVNDYLSLNRNMNTEFVTLKAALKPESASVVVSERGINVRVRFSKLVQSNQI